MTVATGATSAGGEGVMMVMMRDKVGQEFRTLSRSLQRYDVTTPLQNVVSGRGNEGMENGSTR